MKIRFLREVPVGHKVYRPNDEADADIVRGALWVRSSGSRTGRRLEADDFEFVIDQTDFDKLLEGGERVAKPKALKNFPKEIAVPFGPYQAAVEYWHDGDTVAAVVDAGLDHYPVVWIRLTEKGGKGVYAPELRDPGGLATLAFAQSLAVDGTPFRLATELAPVSHEEERSLVRFVGSMELANGTDVGASINEFVAIKGYGKGRT